MQNSPVLNNFLSFSRHTVPLAALHHPPVQASLVKATEPGDTPWPQKLARDAVQLSEMDLAQVSGNQQFPTRTPRHGFGVKSWPQTRPNRGFDAATLAAATLSCNHHTSGPQALCVLNHTLLAPCPRCVTRGDVQPMFASRHTENHITPQRKHPLATGRYLAGCFQHPCETPLRGSPFSHIPGFLMALI